VIPPRLFFVMTLEPSRLPMILSSMNSLNISVLTLLLHGLIVIRKLLLFSICLRNCNLLISSPKHKLERSSTSFAQTQCLRSALSLREGVKAHVGPYTAVPIYIYLHLYWWLSLSLIVCATDYPKVTFFTCKVGMHPLTHSLCEVFTLECLFYENLGELSDQ